MIETLKKLLEKLIDENYDKKTIVYLSVAIEILEKLIKREMEIDEEFKNNSSKKH